MTRFDDLRSWMVVMAGRRDGDSRTASRADLEGTLAPMVRVALRRGVGVPALVRWVRDAVPRIAGRDNPPAPEAYAPEITRLLCAAFLQQADRCEPDRPRDQDTVAGW